MNNTLQTSLDRKRCIRLVTSHADGDAYDGVVLHLAESIIVVREFRDFVADGILVFPRKSIASIRDGDFEACENEILRRSGEIKSAGKVPWLKNVDTIKDILSCLSRRKIWPAIEVQNGELPLFIGPITEIASNSVTLHCYDAAGNWTDNQTIAYKEVFRVDFGSKYLNYFNDYMETSASPHMRATQKGGIAVRNK